MILVIFFYGKVVEQPNNSQDYVESDGNQFRIVGSSLMLLKVIFDYMKIIHFFPQISLEASRKLFEHLKVYIQNFENI